MMFSRNLEDQALYYPELKQSITNEILNNKCNVENFIVDGEICCFSRANKKFIDFQDLRKKVEDPDRIYFVVLFDLLYLNNSDISKETLDLRKLNLVKFFQNLGKSFKIESGTKVSFKESDTLDKISSLFKKARLENNEGLVLKELGEKSKYNFGKRQWYKVKSLDSKNCETLDLVPIAAFRGTGKNANKFSSFLMASYDQTSDSYIALCKLGTGFSEESLDMISKSFGKLILKTKPENYIIPKAMKPTLYIKPAEIWEVGFDSFTVSQNYSLGAGLIEGNSSTCGLSLRFPRFYRLRPDKSIETSNSPEEILSIYLKLRSNPNDL